MHQLREAVQDFWQEVGRLLAFLGPFAVRQEPQFLPFTAGTNHISSAILAASTSAGKLITETIGKQHCKSKNNLNKADVPMESAFPVVSTCFYLPSTWYHANNSSLHRKIWTQNETVFHSHQWVCTMCSPFCRCFLLLFHLLVELHWVLPSRP